MELSPVIFLAGQFVVGKVGLMQTEMQTGDQRINVKLKCKFSAFEATVLRSNILRDEERTKHKH
jgi:hypothetical protein